MIPHAGTLELSASRLAHNVRTLGTRLPHTALCATVKANAYGHGLREILPLLARNHITWTCVYSLTEAADVIALSAETNVLALAPIVLREAGTLAPADLRTIAHPRVRINLVDGSSAERLAALLAADGLSARVHVQLDTGLTRAGVAEADLPALVETLLGAPALTLEGLFSHLSHGDAPNHPTLADQASRLAAAADPLRRRVPGLMVHLQNSGGSFHLPGPPFDMARVGIALYGLQPSAVDPVPGLLPIARLTAPILSIHTRPAGVGVGYGHLFTTTRESRLGIVPVGYADGYPRQLTGRGVVQAGDRTVPVVGRVSMDQLIIDLTDTPAREGDQVTVFSDNAADPNSIDAVAMATGTIGYEIATGFSHRLIRTTIP